LEDENFPEAGSLKGLLLHERSVRANTLVLISDLYGCEPTSLRLNPDLYTDLNTLGPFRATSLNRMVFNAQMLKWGYNIKVDLLVEGTSD
jgi:hypothetical protein